MIMCGSKNGHQKTLDYVLKNVIHILGREDLYGHLNDHENVSI